MSENSKSEQLLEEAWNERRVGNYIKARELTERAEAMCRDNDYNILGRVFHIFAQFESDHEDYKKALEFYRKSLEHYRKAETPDRIAHSTRHIADTERTLGSYEASEENYREAIRIYRASDEMGAGELANALAGFAQTLKNRGKISEARAAWKETKELYKTCGIQAGVEQAQQELGSLGSE